MKTKFLTKRKIASILAVCIAIAIAAIICAPTLMVYAAYSGQSGNMSGEMHSATLAASVGTETPSITILTHGLEGDAGDWSNGFTGTRYSGTFFKKDETSIIEKMRSTLSSGINLYRAETNSSSSFTLYSEYSTTEIPSINDFSKHTVIVMDIDDTKINTMQELYNRLHYVIDKISYD